MLKQLNKERRKEEDVKGRVYTEQELAVTSGPSDDSHEEDRKYPVELATATSSINQTAV